jgi:hypothetical protein
MLNKFTADLKGKMDCFRNRWLHVGMDVGPIDRIKTAEKVKKVYKQMGFKKPEIIWCNSPLETIRILKDYNTLCEDVLMYPPVKTGIFTIFNNIINDGWDITEAVQKNLQLPESNLGKFVTAANRRVGHVEDKIRVALFFLRSFSSLDLIEREIGDAWCDDLFNDRSIFFEDVAYYSFFEKELKVNFRYSLMPLLDLWETCGWWIPLTDKILISENPQNAFYRIIENNPQNGIPVLHKDGDAALQFKDGFCVYALNGIRVPKEIALTPRNELDPKLILHETNPEVRREIVRKIGIEQVCQSLNTKTIDRQGDYELLLLDLGDGRRRPYLKMKNPSIGVYHSEGVLPEIVSVKEALDWRNGTEEIPFTIT